MSEPAPRRAPNLRERILELGTLRIALLASVAVLVASSFFASPYPFAGDELDAAVAMVVTAGPSESPEVAWSFGLLWTTLIAPPLAVMMVFVVPLDMLMSRIYMTDKQGAERARYRRILAAEALALALLVGVWTPFFVALLSL